MASDVLERLSSSCPSSAEPEPPRAKGSGLSVVASLGPLSGMPGGPSTNPAGGRLDGISRGSPADVPADEPSCEISRRPEEGIGMTGLTPGESPAESLPPEAASPSEEPAAGATASTGELPGSADSPSEEPTEGAAGVLAKKGWVFEASPGLWLEASPKKDVAAAAARSLKEADGCGSSARPADHAPAGTEGDQPSAGAEGDPAPVGVVDGQPSVGVASDPAPVGVVGDQPSVGVADDRVPVGVASDPIPVGVVGDQPSAGAEGDRPSAGVGSSVGGVEVRASSSRGRRLLRRRGLVALALAAEVFWWGVCWSSGS